MKRLGSSSKCYDFTTTLIHRERDREREREREREGRERKIHGKELGFLDLNL
jgi:hypothetical protein